MIWRLNFLGLKESYAFYQFGSIMTFSISKINNEMRNIHIHHPSFCTPLTHDTDSSRHPWHPARKKKVSCSISQSAAIWVSPTKLRDLRMQQMKPSLQRTMEGGCFPLACGSRCFHSGQRFGERVASFFCLQGLRQIVAAPLAVASERRRLSWDVEIQGDLHILLLLPREKLGSVPTVPSLLQSNSGSSSFPAKQSMWQWDNRTHSKQDLETPAHPQVFLLELLSTRAWGWAGSGGQRGLVCWAFSPGGAGKTTCTDGTQPIKDR